MAFASDLTETALQIAAMRFSFGINIICIFFEAEFNLQMQQNSD